MARVEGGCCLLSPDVMRLCPLRVDLRPGLPTPSPSLEDFPAAPFCWRFCNFYAAHGVRGVGRISVRRSSPYSVDFYQATAVPCPRFSIVDRHRFAFQDRRYLDGKNSLRIFRLNAINKTVAQTHNPLVPSSTLGGPTRIEKANLSELAFSLVSRCRHCCQHQLLLNQETDLLP